jgi:hypothetical protein
MKVMYIRAARHPMQPILSVPDGPFFLSFQ